VVCSSASDSTSSETRTSYSSQKPLPCVWSINTSHHYRIPQKRGCLEMSSLIILCIIILVKWWLRNVVCIAESEVSVLTWDPFGFNPASYLTAQKWSQKPLHLLPLYGSFCRAGSITCNGRKGLALFNSSVRKAYKCEIKHNNKSARHFYTSSYLSAFQVWRYFSVSRNIQMSALFLMAVVQFNYVPFQCGLELNI
jgi:hypothetical protein